MLRWNISSNYSNSYQFNRSICACEICAKIREKTQQNMHEFVEMNQLGCCMIVNNLTSLFLLFFFYFQIEKHWEFWMQIFGQYSASKYTQINTIVLHQRPNIHAMSIFRSKCNRMQIKQTLDHFAIWKFILQNLAISCAESLCCWRFFFFIVYGLSNEFC